MYFFCRILEAQDLHMKNSKRTQRVISFLTPAENIAREKHLITLSLSSQSNMFQTNKSVQQLSLYKWRKLTDKLQAEITITLQIFSNNSFVSNQEHNFTDCSIDSKYTTWLWEFRCQFTIILYWYNWQIQQHNCPVLIHFDRQQNLSDKIYVVLSTVCRNWCCWLVSSIVIMYWCR